MWRRRVSAGSEGRRRKPPAKAGHGVVPARRDEDGRRSSPAYGGGSPGVPPTLDAARGSKGHCIPLLLRHFPPACKSRAKLRRKPQIPSTTLHNIVAKTRVLRGKNGAVVAHFRAKVAPKSHENGPFCTPRGVFHTPKPSWRSPNAAATPKKTLPKSGHPPKKFSGIFSRRVCAHRPSRKTLSARRTARRVNRSAKACGGMADAAVCGAATFSL